MFAFIPVLPVFTLYVYGLSRELLKVLQVTTFFSILILAQSTILNVFPDAFYSGFKIVYNPFYMYGTWFNHFRIVLEGVLTGWLVLLLFPKKSLTYLPILFTLCLVLLGYLLSFTMYDVLKGTSYPDLTWQSTIYGYLFILIAIGFVLGREQKFYYLPILLPLLMLAYQGLHGLQYLRYCTYLKFYYFS